MIETTNGHIDVARLAARVEEALATRAPGPVPAPPLPRALRRGIDREVDAYLAEMERKAAVRRELPPRLSGWPLRLLRRPILLALRVHGLVFRDQRAANAQLAGAVRALADHATSLGELAAAFSERIAAQDGRIRELEARVGELSDPVEGEARAPSGPRGRHGA